MDSSKFKKNAILMRKLLKDFGYDVKLTHSQEVLARLNGFRNRHAALVKNEEIAIPKGETTIILAGTNKLNEECFRCKNSFDRDDGKWDDVDSSLFICYDCDEKFTPPKVSANFNTDDYTFEVKFDCSEWLLQASNEELLDLIKCDFSSDYATDVIYYFYNESHPELKKASDYLNAISDIKSKKDVSGFSVSVDENEFQKWNSWLQSTYEEMSGNIIDNDIIKDSSGNIVCEMSFSKIKNYLDMRY